MADARAAAVPVVQGLLNAPSLRVATAAADTLGRMSRVIHPKPVLRRDVIGDLRDAINGRGKQQDAEDFRAACIEALVALAGRPDQNELAPLFFNLLDPAENERTRKAALRGIAVVGDNRHANRVLTLIATEPVPEVRVAAYQAMGAIGAFANGKEILEGVKPAERDPAVRAAAWEAFVTLLPKAPNPQALVELKDVTFKGQPGLRLPVLQELALRQERANNLQELALTHEDIGGTYMQLGRPREAIESFRKSLDFWLAQPVQPRVLDGLIANQMDALLAAKQFADAVKFAQQMIARDPPIERTAAAKIADVAETLLEEKKRGEALQLVNEAQKMTPPLKSPFADRLAVVKARAEAAAPQPQPSPQPPTQPQSPAPPPQ
jgi:tetratricopeptide (TPR) repeat protein